MCSLHSTRENDKIIAKDRLRQELLQSGNVTDTSSLTTITLDLSFLDDNYSLENDSNQNKTSGSSHNTFDLTEEPELPTTNYLLD